MVQELEEIKKRHAKKSDGIDSLHQRLVEALRNIPESNKEVTAYQLQVT
jgi:predicted small metal-binding protein